MKITRMLAFSAVPFAASISESWPALAQLKSTLWWAASTPPWKPGRPAARLPKTRSHGGKACSTDATLYGGCRRKAW